MYDSTLSRLLKLAMLIVFGVGGCMCIWSAGDLGSIGTIQLEYSFADVVANSYLTAVYIQTEKWSGSGVIVGKNIVLTARHVILDAKEFTIRDCYGKEYEGICAVTSPNNDFGIITVDEEFSNVATLGDSSELVIGEVLFAIGSPLGDTFFNEVCKGIVSGLNRDLEYFGTGLMITTDLDGNPGNSGCPVFNGDGEVIGILVGTAGGTNPIVVVVPINLMKDMIDASGI